MRVEPRYLIKNIMRQGGKFREIHSSLDYRAIGIKNMGLSQTLKKMAVSLTWICHFVQSMELCRGAHRVLKQLKQDVMQQRRHHWEAHSPATHVLRMLDMDLGREDGVVVLEEYKLCALRRIVD